MPEELQKNWLPVVLMQVPLSAVAGVETEVLLLMTGKKEELRTDE